MDVFYNPFVMTNLLMYVPSYTGLGQLCNTHFINWKIIS